MAATQGAYEGKAKRVSKRSGGEVAIYYKDDATAFNGQKHEVFAGKGELNSQITELLFGYLEKAGITTHHKGRLDERTLLAHAVAIIPLEVVVRFKVEGSLQKRTGLAAGTRCEPPIVELYYKRDDLGDPMLNDDHVHLLGLASSAELATLRQLAVLAAGKLKQLFDRADLDLFDLKFEFGNTEDGRLLLADEVSPDTCRLRDAKTGTVFDKDRFRRDLGDLLEGYREVYGRLRRVIG